MSINKVLAASLLALPFSAFANEVPDNNVKFGLQLGLGVGGDTLAEFEFDDGSNEEIKAGSGLILGMSLQHSLGLNYDMPVDGKISLNYMFDSVDAENGDASFKRFPLDMVILSRVNSISFGGGITYHMNPALSIDAPGLKGDVDFDNALGFKAEANYQFPSKSAASYSIGLEYTNIDYKINGFSVDGSGFNLMLKSSF